MASSAAFSTSSSLAPLFMAFVALSLAFLSFLFALKELSTFLTSKVSATSGCFLIRFLRYLPVLYNILPIK